MSTVRIVETFATCRETGCWQQEWDAGIMDDSQLWAIFLQQSCSSAVICLSGTMQAMTGVATTAITRTTVAIWEALRNTFYPTPKFHLAGDFRTSHCYVVGEYFRPNLARLIHT